MSGSCSSARSTDPFHIGQSLIAKAGASWSHSRRGIWEIVIILSVMLVVAPSVFARTAVPNETAIGQRRVALVIGNSDYRYVPQLVNPRNDAQLVARTLQSIGFVLVGGKAQDNLDKAHFDKAIEELGDQISGADVALFYYAGHGVQVHGSNYLVPVDANPTREADVNFQFVNSETVLDEMQDAKTRLNVIILDACRNNPFGGRGLRGISVGLAQMHAPPGTLISYATQPGNVASDGTKGDSPYTLALVDQIRQPGYDIFHVFNQVGLEVEKQTDGEQEPWVSNSPINGDFYFAGPPVTPSGLASGVPDPDVVFWESIESSRNAQDYRSYLEEFPNGHFAPLARERLTRYQHVTNEVAASSQPSSMPSVSKKLAAISNRRPNPPPNAVPTQIALASPTESVTTPGVAINNNFVVIGDSLDRADAELLEKRFARFGYRPTVIPAEAAPDRYSLRFGPYSAADAAKARDGLARYWHDLTFHLIVNSPDGPLMDEASANRALETVHHLGAQPLLVSRQENGQTRYQVEIGPFVTQKEAMTAGALLGEKYTDSLDCPWGHCNWQYTWTGVPPKLLCADAQRSCKPDS